MTDTPLDPLERLTEVTFGLLMTLTFTGTISVALGQGATVRQILLAALGCNIAWGIVDGAMHVLMSVVERGRGAARLRALRAAPTDIAEAMLRDLLPGGAGQVMEAAQVADLTAWLRRPGTATPPAGIARGDLRAAFTVLALVVGSTFPPALPFLILEDPFVAMRASNLIAVAMLFLIGWKMDSLMGHPRPPMRAVMPVVGCLLVMITILLGG